MFRKNSRVRPEGFGAWKTGKLADQSWTQGQGARLRAKGNQCLTSSNVGGNLNNGINGSHLNYTWSAFSLGTAAAPHPHVEYLSNCPMTQRYYTGGGAGQSGTAAATWMEQVRTIGGYHFRGPRGLFAPHAAQPTDKGNRPTLHWWWWW